MDCYWCLFRLAVRLVSCDCCVVCAEKMEKVRKVIFWRVFFSIISTFENKRVTGSRFESRRPKLSLSGKSVLFSQERFQCLLDVFTTTPNAFNMFSMFSSLSKISLCRLPF